MAIPTGWIECPSHGLPINDTFIAFKTFLSSKYDKQLGDLAQTWSFQKLLDKCQKNIGLVIDLTNTKRYYNPNNELADGVLYEKMQCEGHTKTISRELVEQFFGICENARKSSPERLIGVHCTHGLNRTGFLICSYLIEKCNYRVNEAIEEFNKKRQPGICRQQYVDQLYALYDPNGECPKIMATECPYLDEAQPKPEANSSEARRKVTVASQVVRCFKRNEDDLTDNAIRRYETDIPDEYSSRRRPLRAQSTTDEEYEEQTQKKDFVRNLESERSYCIRPQELRSYWKDSHPRESSWGVRRSYWNESGDGSTWERQREEDYNYDDYRRDEGPRYGYRSVASAGSYRHEYGDRRGWYYGAESDHYGDEGRYSSYGRHRPYLGGTYNHQPPYYRHADQHERYHRSPERSAYRYHAQQRAPLSRPSYVPYDHHDAQRFYAQWNQDHNYK